MATSYHLRVVTPERVIMDQETTEIIVRTTEGEIGILAHHMQIISPLVPHIMTIYDVDGQTTQLTVAGGFIEVRDEGVTVLADAAETADQIDVARAQRARERALEMINGAHGQTEVDLARAQRAVTRAENRLKLAGLDLQNLTH
ncbi:MAG: ATP synthase F1 subunit epsilon [Sulfobacillus acidophilus]|uniref:ATP synthase epsilon chain n=1 Tax=Sulfobacillus acidophilus TaxID=53633 RepID=A0A2T2WF92_9FIRM|nr:MAG: ATP synthase F1 subunit epsilon [Sulfobacillus acidophilus]